MTEHERQLNEIKARFEALGSNSSEEVAFMMVAVICRMAVEMDQRPSAVVPMVRSAVETLDTRWDEMLAVLDA